MLFLLLGACNPAGPSQQQLHSFYSQPNSQKVQTEIEVRKRPVTQLADMLAQHSFLQLELPESILLGRVVQVRQDPENSDFLVATDDNLLLRFNQMGNYLRSYGQKGSGPGEYYQVRDFALFGNGDILMITPFKVIHFDRNAQLRDEIHVENWTAKPYNLKEIEIVHDFVFIYTMGHKKDPHAQTVLIFDQQLALLSGFHPHDERQESMPTSIENQMTQLGETIVVVDLFDFRMTQYQHDGNLAHDYLIAKTDFDFDAIDQKRLRDRKYLEKLAMTYFQTLNNIQTLYGLDQQVFVYHVNAQSGINAPGLFNPTTGQFIRFEMQQPQQSFNPQAFFADPVGVTTDHALILMPGGLDQEEWFNQYWPEPLNTLQREEAGSLKPVLLTATFRDWQ